MNFFVHLKILRLRLSLFWRLAQKIQLRLRFLSLFCQIVVDHFLLQKIESILQNVKEYDFP